ncbi:PREDICTED: probable receptor-like protein kinase At5g59700 [Nicotiana attenuata]|uniref:probable receptor-like protein kinase At5g59700 n=1 Tax=Nicotiana attenuata TaxID=49451 RepID=UPI000904F59D|nr:PREDICTED: probable receptor-like protein kinase At5g59700 [Nicotiana attenuata]
MNVGGPYDALGADVPPSANAFSKEGGSIRRGAVAIIGDGCKFGSYLVNEELVIPRFWAIVKDRETKTNISNNCPLNINISSSGEDCTTLDRNWDGFLTQPCCGLPFNRYLRALARWTNQTGHIFLNSTQQMDCLTWTKNTSSNTFSCGIEKLTSGAGGCSYYSDIDVVNELGNRLKSLRDDCSLMDSDGGLTKGCNQCLKTWGALASKSKNNSMKLEADICRFSMLILLTSQRISDESWIDEFFHCLGDNSLPLVSSRSETRHRTKFKRGKILKSIFTTIIAIAEFLDKRVFKYADLGILIGGIVGLVVIIIIAVWILLKRKNEVKPSSGRYISDGSYSEESSYRKLSLKEIYSATDNLSMSNFIGQGIAGKVYKSILADGQYVAIKHIIKDEQMDTFVREVTSLSHIRHPNLVSLLGHYDGPNECFLVYELCHNGNLSEWLFGKSKYLSWRRRLEIALDCARGLLFLHSYPQGSIVHRDIKPANILLSASFEAKLSDFGLSKIISIGHSYASSEVRGTFGYVDPEYQKNRHVNSYGDVYSFGIVLLQLLSGQRVINLDLQNPMLLSKMAKNLTKGGNIKEFADPKMEGKFSMEAFELILKLALVSIGLKQQRPSMEQVVVKLEEALDLSTRVESVHL